MSAKYEVAIINPASTHGVKLPYMMKTRHFYVFLSPAMMKIF